MGPRDVSFGNPLVAETSRPIASAARSHGFIFSPPLLFTYEFKLHSQSVGEEAGSREQRSRAGRFVSAE